MILAYGQDDRVCAYPALMSILTTEACDKTAICMLSDKEEVGSMGNTDAKSDFLKLLLLELMDKTGEGATELNLLRALDKSYCLSADVNAAFDPIFPAPYEKRNCAMINYGVAISKYTGARGKSGSSDASAELDVLEKISGLKCGEDFKVGYSPERINPGDQVHRVENIKKIVLFIW